VESQVVQSCFQKPLNILLRQAIEYLVATRMKAAAFSNQAPVGGSDTTCCKIKFAE